MIKKTKQTLLVLSILSLASCGGGGGGSSSAVAPQAAPGGSGGGNSGGGNSGGGSGGGATGTVVTGGLVPGGAAAEFGSSLQGVELDVASGGTGASIDFGDIQAFGSVVLNDVTVNTDSADFVVEGASGSQSDLRQGQQVLVLSDSSGTTATSVHYRSNVKGPVTSVSVIDAEQSAAQFVVLGQRVLSDATTTLSNVNLVDIAVSDLLEVSGTLTSNGDIQASYIELKASLAEYKVTGRASNTTATNFAINGLTVDYSSATLDDFNGPIADNDVVEVKGAPGSFTAPDQLSASKVELLPVLTVGDNVPARIEGFINRFGSATDFEVQTAPVGTTASTTFVNGSASSLALNVKVQVEGSFDANGTLQAAKITIQPTNAIRAEGNVESIDLGAERVALLGVEFQVRALTRFEDNSSANVDPFTLADIGIGDELEVRGYLDGAQVVATRVEREDPEDRARLRGPVTAEDAANGTVDILSVRITGASGITVYEDINDAVISQSEFHDAVELGTFVKADWDTFSDTNQTVDELSIED